MICLVTASSKSEVGLRATIDSIIASTNYPKRHKSILVIADRRESLASAQTITNSRYVWTQAPRVFQTLSLKWSFAWWMIQRSWGCAEAQRLRTRQRLGLPSFKARRYSEAQQQADTAHSVFECFTSHHMVKAFVSTFGGVTCLLCRRICRRQPIR